MHAVRVTGTRASTSAATLIAVVVVAATFVSGCGELRASRAANAPSAVTIRPGNTVTIPPSDDPSVVEEVGFDGSVSNLAEREVLLRSLAQVVVPAAVARKALLVVDVIGSRGFNGGIPVVSIDTSNDLSSGQLTVGEAEATIAQRAVTAVLARLHDGTADGSDLVGWLRRVEQDHRNFPDSQFLATYLGDGAQNTPDCDVLLTPIADPASVPAVVRACEVGDPLDLHGIELQLLGVGLAVGPGGLSEAESLEVQNFLVCLGRSAGAHVTEVAVAPVADSAA